MQDLNNVRFAPAKTYEDVLNTGAWSGPTTIDTFEVWDADTGRYLGEYIRVNEKITMMPHMRCVGRD